MALASLRSRLILLVTFVLVAGFVATNLVSFKVSRDAKRDSVLQTELPLTGDNIYSEIQIDLVRPVFVASLMANDTFLHDWVRDGEASAAPIVRYLDAIRRRYDSFTAFFISEATRRYYHFSGVPQVVSEDDPEDVWYFRARGMAQPYEINIDPNQAQDNRLTIFINYRVIDEDGAFLGITGVGLELDAVAKLVERYRSQFRRTVYFVNRSGLVTIHPDPEKAYNLRLAEIEGMADAAAEILAQERGAFEIERAHGSVLLTTRYIPELDWKLVVEADEADVLRDLDTGFASNLAIGLTAIILTVIAVILAVNRYQRRLEEMATTDPLTGLANRQLFDAHLDQAVRRGRRSGRPVSLVLFDLDRFKQLNDRHGHLAGDAVLRRVADVAREAVRTVDTVCRWGGEEFAILMEDCPAPKAGAAAEKIRRALESSDLLQDLSGSETDRAPVTASFGVAALSADDLGGGDAPTGPAIERLLSAADRSLYRAKAAGRNRVEAA
ncbi:MAG: sensor domain-containing diguanylate cyclase [Alphaproteobacteria bacterium]|nr:sensor domain-containing diguanylate cyclase [Alphaproteobacteria bacterium]